MSATRNNTNKSATSKSVAINKHCAFCFNAGEPETTYTSHFLRESKDPHSKVVCPLLLSNVCPDCGKKGHTRKECKNKYKYNNTKVSQSSKAAAPTKVITKSSNCFEALDSSDSEDEEKQICAPIAPDSAFKAVSFVDTFPPLPTSGASMAKRAPIATHGNFAAALMAPPMSKPIRTCKSVASYALPNDAEDDDTSDTEITAIYNQALAQFNSQKKLCASTENWAALDDPSSDEEDW